MVRQIDLHGIQDVGDDTVGPFEGLDPIVSWGASASALGVDFEVRKETNTRTGLIEVG